MADIVVPTLGESVVEATVARWLKAVGDPVAVDEPLVELETDKVTVEVNAKAAGVLAEIAVPEGQDVAVGATLGRIDEAGKADGKPAARPAETAGNGADAPAADAARPAATAAAKKTSGGAPGGSSDADNTIDIIVPTLGESITEATVARWLKEAGATVDADEPIVELETEKVTLEVNAPAAGVIAEIAAPAGADVAVGGLLGRLKAGPGATVAVTDAGPEQPVKREDPKPAAPAAEARPAPAVPAAPAAPAAPAPTRKANLAYPLAPAVRKLIEEHNLDPAKIPASGKDGRLTKTDVQAFLAQPKAAPAAPAAAPAPFPSAAELPPREERSDEQRVRMTRLRQRIAQRLKEAQNTAAMLTTFNEVDMTAVMALRNQYRDAFEKKHGVRLGFMSFFVKAAIAALKEIPAVNAEIYGDEIIYKNYYDIGVAVGTPQGLVVPVLRGADTLTFAEIEGTIADLAARARDGKLTMAELAGGTFTITNGGVYGSLLSTPILNPPQSGILGMHKIQNRPMDVGGKIELRPMMYLALSYDHRIIDGREAVTFLVRIKEAIEDPARLLVGL